MDLLEIGPVNACEMPLKNDEVENFSIGLRCYRTRKERKVFEACGKKKKLASKPLSSRRKPQSACAVTSGYPDAPSTRVQRAPGHPDDPPLKSFSNSSG